MNSIISKNKFIYDGLMKMSRLAKIGIRNFAETLILKTQNAPISLKSLKTINHNIWIKIQFTQKRNLPYQIER